VKIKKQRLNQIFDAVPSKKILVIGDIMLDEYFWGTVERISPEAPVPVVDVGEETYRLGGAGNVVRNLSSLKAGVGICSIVGNDSQGDRIKELLECDGVSADGIIHDPGRRTITKTRVIAHTQQVVRIDKENRERISADIHSSLLELFMGMIDSSDAVVISDYGKGLVTPELIGRITSEAGKRDILVSIDPKERNFQHYRNAGVITPNTKELAFGSGLPVSTEAEIAVAAARIFDMLGCKMLLATRGAHGMSLFEGRDKITHIPTAAKKVYDVTGAGDTVISVFTLAIAAGATPVEAAMISNIAAGIVVGEIGAATVELEALRSSCLEEIGG
jgi:D-beta-D-heptose 7-phosphate kinase/D-beta-D-heptose 1-phosphate adenosyltransferase